MAVPQLDTEMSEADRRKLVKNIRERGAEGYTMAEQQAAPTQTFANEAQQLITSMGGMEFHPEAMAAISDPLQGQAQSAQEYAEALRQIYADSEQRELAYGNEYYDMMPTVIGGVNQGLVDYDEKLAAHAAEQAAYEASRRRGGGGGGGTPVLPGYQMDQDSVGNEVPVWWNRLSPNQQNALVDVSNRHPDIVQAFDNEADDYFRGALEQGMSFAQARTTIYRHLTTSLGMAPADAAALLAPYVAVWESAWGPGATGFGSYTAPAPAPAPTSATSRHSARTATTTTSTPTKQYNVGGGVTVF